MTQNLPSRQTTPSQRAVASRALPLRRQCLLLAAMAAVMILAIATALGIRAWQTPVESEPAPAEPGTFIPTKEQLARFAPVSVVSARFHSVILADGRIVTDDDTTTPVFSPYSGRVTRIIAKAGDVVRRGQPLFAIQATEFVQGQNDLAAAAAAMRTSESQLAVARANEVRQHALYDARGAALKDWLQSQSDLIAAEGAHRTAQTALAAVRNRLRILGRSDPEIASIETAKGDSDAGAETLVPAPVGGTVIQRQIAPGQYINSAANGAAGPVYTIGDLSTVWMVANIREVDAPAIQVGQPVEVSVLAFPGRVFAARLAYVGATVDGATRRVTVRAELPNPEGALAPGMFARFRIVTSGNDDSPAVPEGAIVYDGDTAHVWTLRADGRLARTEIRLGRTLDGMTEVLHGLRPGDTVVTTGALFLDRAAASG